MHPSDILFQIACVMAFNSLYIFGFFNAGTYRLKNSALSAPGFRMDHEDIKEEGRIRKEDINPESRELLSYFRIWVENTIGDFYAKPIITCPVCMASLHSVPVYGLLCLVMGWKLLFLYPMYICALAALNKALIPVFTEKD